MDFDHPSAFKAAVAMAALRGEQSTADLAMRYGVTPQQVILWQSELADNAASVFRSADREQSLVEPEVALEDGQAMTLSALTAALADAKFRTFFEQASNFAALLLLDGTTIEANRVCLEECGFLRDEVIGRKFWQCGWWLGSQERQELIRGAVAQAAAGTVCRFESSYCLADGSERIIALVLAPVTNESGTVLSIAATGIDITERKGVEERLRLLDAINEAIRGATADAKAIMEITTRMVGRHFNVARCAYADLEPDNDRFTIRHDWTAEGVASTVGVYSLDLFGQRAASDMRGGRTLVINDVDNELAWPADQAMFNAIGVKAIICCPLVKNGRLLAMMAVHHGKPRFWSLDEVALLEEMVDRSWAHIERVRANEALRRSEAHLSSLFDQTAAGIALFDLEGRLLSVNNRYCQILQRPRPDLIGRLRREITHPEDVEISQLAFDKMLIDYQPYELEKRYLLPDGTSVWASIAVSIIQPDTGEPVSNVLSVVLDITERKVAEEKLKEADRRKDEFLAMLAHELRNPLAPIGAAADLLRMVRLDDVRLKKTSETISRQVKHMTGLIDDLLDVSRVTRGLVTLDTVDVDVAHVIADAVEQVRAYIESRGHELVIHPSLEPALVHADKKRLVQVMVNLLHNAAKYTPEGGKIACAVLVKDHMVILRVEDSGIGMPDELLSRAFGLFTQAERSADRSQGGLGIGLALVKSLIELHGGTVAAYSDGPGQGSRFDISLPQRVVTPIDTFIASGDATAEILPNALKILIVDDNVDAAQMLAMFLESLGHQVLVEENSASALDCALRQRPDVCLLDIGLPGMNGNDLARHLRERPETASALLVAVTGYGQTQDRESAMQAGFDHYFVKPLDTDNLVKLLNSSAAKSCAV